MLEQSDSREGIEKLVVSLTGIRPKVILKVVASPVVNQTVANHAGAPVASPEQVGTASRQSPVVSPPAKSALAKSRAEPTAVRGAATLKVRDDIQPENDAFVQQIVERFGATVVRITDAPRRKIAVVDPEESDDN